MQIKGSTFIGNAGPIPVYAHWSALVLVGLAFLWGPDLQSSIAILVALLLAIVLHELGHALVAHFYKLPGIMIVLWGIGGVMLSQRNGPERPGRELAISAAGPAVNYVLAGLAFGGIYLLRQMAPDLLIDQDGQQTIWALQLFYFYAINLILAVFNTLPIYPLDGGHIAYSALRLLRFESRTARKICVGLAVVFGGAVVALDVWWRNGTPSVFNIVLVLFLISMSVQWMKAPTS